MRKETGWKEDFDTPIKPDSAALANAKLRRAGPIGKLVVKLTKELDPVVDDAFKNEPINLTSFLPH